MRWQSKEIAHSGNEEGSIVHTWRRRVHSTQLSLWRRLVCLTLPDAGAEEEDASGCSVGGMGAQALKGGSERVGFGRVVETWAKFWYLCRWVKLRGEWDGERLSYKRLMED